MNHRDWFRRLKQGSIDRVLLFHGAEEYIKASALAQLKEALGGEMNDWNMSRMEGGAGVKLDQKVLISACETLPLMAERRLVVVYDCGWLQGREEAGEIAEYIARVPSSTCLVFYEHGSADKRKKLFKAIRDNGTEVEFEELNDVETQKWLQREAKRLGRSMGIRAIETLMSRANGLSELSARMAQLAALSGEEGEGGKEPEITVRDVEALLPPPLEENIYRMVDQLAAGLKGEALASLEGLLLEGKEPLALMSAISRQYRQMLMVVGLRERGVAGAEWAKVIGTQGFVVDRLARAARGWDRHRLTGVVKDCHEADIAVKSGKMSDRLAVEWLMMRIMEKGEK